MDTVEQLVGVGGSSDTKKLKEYLLTGPGLSEFVGQSPLYLHAIRRIPLLACADAIALIVGESGTGKESYARAIHDLSPRSTKPFVPVNCGAIPENLIENELFGHVRGAYTDASTSGRGVISEANGGTLFLDEINSLSKAGQVKLLRFLDDRSYKPLGSATLLSADVRVICATNVSLPDEIRGGRFRDDLYYRISVLVVELPPLKNRDGDVQLLADHFLDHFSKVHIRGIMNFTRDAMEKLMSYGWPGNVRELKNVIEKAIVFAPSNIIHPEDIDLDVLREAYRPNSLPFWQIKATAVSKLEGEYLLKLLGENNWNISRAAHSAGTSRRSLQRMMKKHFISTATTPRKGATHLSHP